MTENTPDTPRKGTPKPAENTREERLRAALRANLQKRKAQARGRAAGDNEGQEDG
ncbi:hypothetical protein [Paenirhodobacter sp.]|jgi:hypothetical protein|uniref:hypothetical protein n=1 Tax=Paenirhodobacter sp. TaxID=1965326 RepID=UPI003B503A78